MWGRKTKSVMRNERRQVAQLMTAVCDKRITGREFVKKLLQVNSRPDDILEGAIDLLWSTFQPEFGRPGFDVNDPPFRIRRQMALLRRFLISEQSYDWPADAFRQDDIYSSIRLPLAVVAILSTLASIVVAMIFPFAIFLAVTLSVLTVWLLAREPEANERDRERMEMRARKFGDLKWWPFTSADSFHATGSVRMLLRGSLM